MESTSRPLLACDPSEIAAAERAAHLALLKRLFKAGLERSWVKDELVIGFPAEDRERVEQFVRNERKCCSFLDFRVERPSDDVRLHVSGPAEARRIIEAYLPEHEEA